MGALCGKGLFKVLAAIIAILASGSILGCEDDGLVGPPRRPDAGPEATLSLDGGTNILRVVELRVPSHGRTSTSAVLPGARVQLRLPSAAHGVSSSPEHNMRATLGAGVAGGSR